MIKFNTIQFNTIHRMSISSNEINSVLLSLNVNKVKYITISARASKPNLANLPLIRFSWATIGVSVVLVKTN